MEKVEVIFYDDDEITVLDRQLVDYGSEVIYNGTVPTKEPENHIEYKFIGWTNEENLKSVTENLVLVAQYEVNNPKENYENALFKASLENAMNANLNATIAAGKRVNAQQKALENETRTPEEIVAEILKNGKAEIGINKQQDVER